MRRAKRARRRPVRGSGREEEPAGGAGLRAPAGRRAQVMPLGRWALLYNQETARLSSAPSTRWASAPGVSRGAASA
ncbi:MAG: hypothetical protein OXE42_10370 [Gammaproteobacteria bacterium]|nr:hypothetical protein [Gammaproteobacteria bacterium]